MIASGDVLGRDASEFGEFRVEGRAISGTANRVEGLEAFSSDPDEQQGYYLPISVEPWEGAKVESSRRPGAQVALADDGDVLVFLGGDAPDQVTSLEVIPAAGDPATWSVSVSAAAAVPVASRQRRAVARKAS